mmetsp:Transcript_23609/g.54984  ORF Transcript_23609/g.54984 Transcript_23609/m.54984 type:complete len:209 (-) Transcript_23609:231-857(-)
MSVYGSAAGLPPTAGACVGAQPAWPQPPPTAGPGPCPVGGMPPTRMSYSVVDSQYMGVYNPASSYGAGATSGALAADKNTMEPIQKWTNDDVLRYGNAKDSEEWFQAQRLWHDKARYDQMVWQQQNTEMMQDWQDRQRELLLKQQQAQQQAMYPGFYGGKGGQSPYAYPGDMYRPPGGQRPPPPPPGAGGQPGSPPANAYGRRKKGCC